LVGFVQVQTLFATDFLCAFQMELNKRKNQLKLLLQTHQMLQVSVRFQQWKQAFQLRRHASAIGILCFLLESCCELYSDWLMCVQVVDFKWPHFVCPLNIGEAHFCSLKKFADFNCVVQSHPNGSVLSFFYCIDFVFVFSQYLFVPRCRRVFVAWRDEYVVPLKQSLQEFRQQQDHRTLSLMFSHWNKYVGVLYSLIDTHHSFVRLHIDRFSKVCLAAQAVSRKFKQLSTIRRWHRIAVIERLGRQQVMNQLSEYFAIWKHELLLKQRYLPGFVHLQRVTVAPHFHAWRQRALALSFVKYLRARVQQRLHVARCTKAICVRQIKAAFSVWRQRHLEIQVFSIFSTLLALRGFMNRPLILLCGSGFYVSSFCSSSCGRVRRVAKSAQIIGDVCTTCQDQSIHVVEVLCSFQSARSTQTSIGSRTLDAASASASRPNRFSSQVNYFFLKLCLIS
jgi:hypothetical protein